MARRRHGWQLPAHSFQVIAITVFFLLTIAFYAFFAPFLWKDLYMYIAMAVYSVLALSVFILYTRCTAIDPADSGVLLSCNETSACKSLKAGSCQEEPGNSVLYTQGDINSHNSSTFSDIACFLCASLAQEDCRKDEKVNDQDNNEEALFCTLCNVEVQKLSKHCRSCDKCVDGFDHHCRWLNNCVGRKNYISFLFLMAVSLAWLAVQFGVGIAVLVRCFTDKRETEIQIVDKLGDGFSRAPFATVVAFCTALALLASVPLGELFFFHMILVRKGITTYEYVVAMREQSEPPGPSVNDEQLSLPSSPVSTATTAISGHSFGLQYRGAWCTPPRIFMDRQDEIIPHLQPGQVPSTVDPDNMDPSGRDKRPPKRHVRISAWKLAKLDSQEAMRAGARARASSSVLKPSSSRGQYHSDNYSSGNSSIRSGMTSPLTGFRKETQPGIVRSPSPLKSSYPPSIASREDTETCPQTPTSLSSPNHANMSIGRETTEQKQPKPPPRTSHYNPIFQPSANRSVMPVQQSNESKERMVGTDSEQRMERRPINTAGHTRPEAYWDQEAGRFMYSQNNTGLSSRTGKELSYSEQSIFFGGPLLREGQVRSFRNAGASSNWQGGTERRGSNQLPVFVPSDYPNDQSS